MLTAELVPAAIVAAAIAPPLLLLWLVVIADSRPEPARVVLGAVFFGVLSTMVAVVVELGLQKLIPLVHNPWLAAYQDALLFAAIPEEALKVSIIAVLALRARDFDEPMDGVVYGAAVGLGFAALENVLYVVGANTQWESVAVMRGVLSVPFHGALGAIAGAYIARARFGRALGAHAHSPGHRRRLLAAAFLVPVVLHALLDGGLFSLKNAPAGTADTPAGVLAILLALVIVLVSGFGAIIYAALLTRRVAHHQKAWLHTKRLPPTHWRDVWAECLIGVGASFVALALVIAGSSATRFVGSGFFALMIGMAWRSGRHLNATAKRRHGAALAASLPPPPPI
ncbi:MAG TPA: PrsW family intramembrane metalloprotease [Xanthobacteraceae bacterium]|jgi:RsiW-degrading membrane proteinase PrsW (M82 family)